jgi:hypothetical protein
MMSEALLWTALARSWSIDRFSPDLAPAAARFSS